MTQYLIATRLSAMAVMLINLRCEYLILDVRSKPLLALCTVLGLATDELARVAGLYGTPVLMFINILITVAAPVALSQGPLHSRVSRVLVVNLTSTLSEVVCMVCYLNLEGVVVYTEVTASNFRHIIASYMTGTTVHVLLSELVILRLRNTDSSWDVKLELPILAFVLGSYLFLTFGIYRYGKTGSENPFIPLLFLIVTGLSIAVSFVLHRIVHDETERVRESARHAATLRQTRHIRRQIEESAQQVLRMRHLRHDLANQMGVVMELAHADHIQEADRYLAELLELSQSYVEGSRE